MGRKAKSDDTDETRPIFKKEVAVALTVEQANEVYDRAQIKRERADELEDELAQHNAKRKAEIKELRGEADRDAAAAHDKKAMVWMDVREVLRGSQMFVVRVDNGATVDQRAATPHELQQDFPGLDRGAALPTPGSSPGSSSSDQGDGDGDEGADPVIATPPGGAPPADDDDALEDDRVGTDGPRSAAEQSTRAPRKRGPRAAAKSTSKPGKAGKRGAGK